MAYQSTKTYGHEVGLSCAFRQWRATHSHCSKLHGYAISIRFVFEATRLDAREWVIDFGGLKELKQQIQDTFDHKTLVAKDDPELKWFQDAAAAGVLDLVVVEAVGCERFARLAFDMGQDWLRRNGYLARVKLASVEVSEHGANSAIYLGPRDGFGNLI